MTHGLQQGNPYIERAFVDTFFPRQGLFNQRANVRTDPISQRNRSRTSTVRGDAHEIMADVIAGYLYAPALVANDFTVWVEANFPFGTPRYPY